MLKVFVEHGVEVREDVCPEGLVEVDCYNPCHSTTPWDYYGGKHWREYSFVLRRAGIEPTLLLTRRRILHPCGTGPGGRVRFGDDMTPGTYRIAVEADKAGVACAALAAHKAEVRAWADGPIDAPPPEACRG